MLNDKGIFRGILTEDFPLLPVLKSSFIGKGTYSVEEAADAMGAGAGAVYKMLEGDKPLYANVEWGLIRFIGRKNPAQAMRLLQEFLDLNGLPFDVRFKMPPKVSKSLNAICEQLHILFTEAEKGKGQ